MSNDALLSEEATRAVTRSKALVYMVLVLAGFGVGLGAYRYTKNEATDDFLFAFDAHAIELIHETDNTAASLFSEVQSLSLSFASSALNTNSVWPNVTEPYFNTIIETAEEHLNFEAFLLAPVIRSRAEKKTFESYATANQYWLSNNHQGQEIVDEFAPISPTIFPFPDSEEPPSYVHVPVWQYGPFPQDSTLTLMDLNTHPVLRRSIELAMSNGRSVLSDTFNADFILEHVLVSSDKGDNEHPGTQRLLRNDGDSDEVSHGLYSMYFQPIFTNFTEEKTVAGFAAAVISWQTFFSDLFQESKPIEVVVEQSCGQTFTYRISGEQAIFRGLGDLHDPAYEFNARQAPLFKQSVVHDGDCTMTKTIYSTDEYKKKFDSKEPVLYTLTACVIFVFTASVFVFYDVMVQRRLRQIHATAQRSNAVVTSLFPRETAERLLKQVSSNEVPPRVRGAGFFRLSTTDKSSTVTAKPTDDISGLLRTSVGASQYVEESRIEGRPLADLFPSATVMFADMTGFTAWSSAREPNQVFILLETIYGAFDKIAKMRRIFKVETIGDCYVAVCGLPEPRENHELVMARFGQECIQAMTMLSRQLEVKLGPETAELGMKPNILVSLDSQSYYCEGLRVGLHSGSVTAGVLRGDKARFQLFGDTVNVTARIEASGLKNKIHVSKETANGIIKAGHDHWLTKRDDKIVAKGKGELETYWVQVEQHTDGSWYDGSAAEVFERISSVDDRRRRLVEWVVGLLENKLQKVIAVRNTLNSKQSHVNEQKHLGLTERDFTDTIIRIPFYKKPQNKTIESSEIDIGRIARGQLRDFVSNIAMLYRDNSFHNMEHAAHVANSVVKLFHSTFEGKGVSEAQLYRQTFGISSDPLMRFAVVLAAIIHDMDHPGVPNVQLVKEGKGQGKSIAEVHSLNLAWELLMKDKYKDLRSLIYTTQDDYERFRSVFVSSVLATDCLDKDLATARRERWESAFAEGFFVNIEGQRHNRATIIIEHLIQGSDIAHTMQHWYLYRKWNERLFRELYAAFSAGRAAEDPSGYWYKGELSFFDHYVIPLAKKLRDCGVYGSIGEEYLRYAERNRLEWEQKGEGIVLEMIEKLKNQNKERPGDKYMI